MDKTAASSPAANESNQVKLIEEVFVSQSCVDRADLSQSTTQPISIPKRKLRRVEGEGHPLDIFPATPPRALSDPDLIFELDAEPELALATEEERTIKQNQSDKDKPWSP